MEYTNEFNYNVSFLSENDSDGGMYRGCGYKASEIATTATMEVVDVDIMADVTDVNVKVNKNRIDEEKEEIVVLDSMSNEEFHEILNEYKLIHATPLNNASQVMNFAKQINRFFKYNDVKLHLIDGRMNESKD